MSLAELLTLTAKANADLAEAKKHRVDPKAAEVVRTGSRFAPMVAKASRAIYEAEQFKRHRRAKCDTAGTPQGRAPRPSTSGRTRGSRRGSASTSQASRDGPSDDDGGGLSPHARALAAEFQAASDELLASWRRKWGYGPYRPEPKQLELLP